MRAKVLRLYAGGIVVSAVVLLTLALTPVSLDFVGGIFSILGHVVGTAALAVAIGFGLRNQTSKPHRAFASAVVALGMWLAIEGLQLFIPDHGAQVSDMMFDTLGATVGFVVTLAVGEAIY